MPSSYKGRSIKLIIALDQLLERDTVTSMLETLLSITEDVEIVTLVHRTGNIVGPIINKKITSSYLSFFFRKKKHLKRFPNWSHSSAKHFKIPRADFYIFLSSGYIHLCKTDPSIPRIDYLFGKSGQFEKLNSDKKLIATCSQSLGNELELKNFRVIAAPFMSRDFPVMANYYENKKILLKTNHLSRVELYNLLSQLGPHYALKIISENPRVKRLKGEFPQVEFLEDLNTSGLYVELIKSLVFIDLTINAFPVDVFSSLCTGVPAFVTSKGFVNQEFLNEEVVIFFDDFENLKNLLQKFLDGEISFKPEILRRYALRFNERIFKNRFLKIFREFK